MFVCTVFALKMLEVASRVGEKGHTSEQLLPAKSVIGAWKKKCFGTL